MGDDILANIFNQEAKAKHEPLALKNGWDVENRFVHHKEM